MIKIIKYPGKEEWQTLLKRPASDNSSIIGKVTEILQAVKTEGDDAVKKFALQFDGVDFRDFELSKAEWEKSASVLSTELKHAIDVAIKNISAFHASQKDRGITVETAPGVICKRKSVAIEKVGLYIPGGTAPLFSTLLMLGIPAVMAGCREVTVCTPSDKNGDIHPAIIYAAMKTGIHRLFRIGGVQAIAAMAYGTKSVPQVYKIFGPGNQYVTCAKMMLNAEGIAIDMPAGPSEVAVLADETCVPEFVAADLLSQAEHGADSQVILVSNREDVIDRVNKCVAEQLSVLPRKDIAQKALLNSKAILVKSLEEGIALLNEYAPEHLIISCKEDEALAEKVINAGSVFLGNYSPESAGDYASGTNHTLPTNGFAKAYSGVSLDSFVKKITFQKLTKEGLNGIAAAIEQMALAEGLHAHAKAVTIRSLTPNPSPKERGAHEFSSERSPLRGVGGLLRPNIQKLIPYSSARSEFEGKASVYLDANENSMGSVLGDHYNRYPDPLQKTLKQAIGKLKGVPTENIFVGNGSDEPIDLLVRAFCEPGEDNMLLFPPTYGMYEVAANINNVAINTVLLTEDFQLDVDTALKAVDRSTKLLFICSPNNPSGNTMKDEDIEALLRGFNGLVVLDEAYVDFSNNRNWLKNLLFHPKLVILQTFSKAWGMAALRVGMAFASKDIIDILNKIKAPYNMNEATQQLALQALTKENVVKQYSETILKERTVLIEGLKKFGFIKKIFPTDANFILTKADNADHLYKYLVSRGIVVRNRSKQARCENCLRITVGTPAENVLLLDALNNYQA